MRNLHTAAEVEPYLKSKKIWIVSKPSLLTAIRPYCPSKQHNYNVRMLSQLDCHWSGNGMNLSFNSASTKGSSHNSGIVNKSTVVQERRGITRREPEAVRQGLQARDKYACVAIQRASSSGLPGVVCSTNNYVYVEQKHLPWSKIPHPQ